MSITQDGTLLSGMNIKKKVSNMNVHRRIMNVIELYSGYAFYMYLSGQETIVYQIDKDKDAFIDEVVASKYLDYIYNCIRDKYPAFPVYIAYGYDILDVYIHEATKIYDSFMSLDRKNIYRTTRFSNTSRLHSYLLTTPLLIGVDRKHYIKYIAHMIKYMSSVQNAQLPGMTPVNIQSNVRKFDLMYVLAELRLSPTYRRPVRALNLFSLPLLRDLMDKTRYPVGKGIYGMIVVVNDKGLVTIDRSVSIKSRLSLKLLCFDTFSRTYHGQIISAFVLFYRHDPDALPGAVRNAINGNCLLQLLNLHSNFTSKTYIEYDEEHKMFDKNYKVVPTNIPDKILREFQLELVVYSEFQRKLLYANYKVDPWVSLKPINSVNKHYAKCNVVASNGHAYPMFSYDSLNNIKNVHYVDQLSQGQFDQVLSMDDNSCINSVARCSEYTKDKQLALDLYKTYQPSQNMFKNKDDDSNAVYYYVNSERQHLWTFIKNMYNIRITDNKAIYDYIKHADIEAGSASILADKHTHVLDHISSYSSFENSAYYRQLPQPPYILSNKKCERSWFVLIKSIKNVPESFKMFYNHRYQKTSYVEAEPTIDPITDGFDCINILVYDFLIRHGAQVEVIGYINGSSIHIDYTEICSDACVTKDTKNKMIGLIIAGGHKDEKTHTISTICRNEVDHMITTCEEFGLQWKLSNNNKGFTFTFSTEYKSRNRSFDLHGTILAYSAIAVMEKMQELINNGITITAFQKDSIFYIDHNNSQKDDIRPHGWKFKQNESKPMYFSKHVLNYDYQSTQIEPVLSEYKNARTLITGAGGMGKTYPFKKTNDPNMVLTVPTNKQKQEFSKETENAVMTHHKYFGIKFDKKESKADKIKNAKAAKFGKKKKYDLAILDECFMRSKAEMTRILTVQDALICLGDINQILSMDDPLDMQFFIDNDFDIIHKERTEDTIGRHAFKFGSLLDQMAESNDQWQFVKDNFKQITLDEMGENTMIISGNHKQNNIFNHYAKEHIYDKMFPVRRVVSSAKEPKGTISMLDKNDPCIFWNRQDINSVRSKGMTHEPAFALTADCIQGETIGKTDIVICKSTRHGVLYTAATRAMKKCRVFYYE